MDRLSSTRDKAYLCSFVWKTSQVQALNLDSIIKQVKLKYNNMFHEQARKHESSI